MPKISRKFILSIVLTTVFLIWVIYYLSLNQNYLSILKNLDPKYLIMIILLDIVSLYQNGLFLKIITEAFSIKIKEHFAIATSTAFYNLILPLRGGSVVRAIYMKKIHGQLYSQFISSLMGNYIIILLVGSIFALITFAVLYTTKKIINIPIIVTFLFIFSFTLYLSIGGKIPTFKNKILGKLNNVITGWHQITTHPKMIPKLVANTIIAFFIESLKVKLIFYSLGIDISLFESLYFATVSVLASFINITPGSLGISEGLFMISSTILHIPPQIGLLAAIINRLLNTIVILILGPICNFKLYKNYHK